jgi:hypothetical protein
MFNEKYTLLYASYPVYDNRARVYRERSHTIGGKRVPVLRHGIRKSVVPVEQGCYSSGLRVFPNRRISNRTHRDRVT